MTEPTPTHTALGGMSVIEVGEGIAAPYAGRMLADAGATVIKVEKPAGDPLRTEHPQFVDDDGHRGSALFEYLNWSKFGTVVDPEADRTILDAAAARADILLIGDRAELVDEWQLDLDELTERHPDLVVVAVTPFGLSGPRSDWRATDLTLQAAAGLMSISGTSEREPLKRGLRASWYEAGMTAAYVAILGYFATLQGHSGSLIDVSVAECLSAELVTTMPAYSFVGGVPGRRHALQDPLASGQPFPVSDGHVSLQLNSHIPMSAFGDLLDQPVLGEARFASHEARLSHARELDGALRDALREERTRGFFVRASQAGLLTGMVQTPEQLLDCPHLEARSAWVPMPGTLGGRPWRMPAPAEGVVRRPAPRLGQHDGVLGSVAAFAR